MAFQQQSSCHSRGLMRTLLPGAQVRGAASGAAATANWVTNAAVSQTFLALTRALGGSGTFLLYACVAAAGAAWVYAALPETKGAALLAAVQCCLARATRCCRACQELTCQALHAWLLSPPHVP